MPPVFASDRVSNCPEDNLSTRYTFLQLSRNANFCHTDICIYIHWPGDWARNSPIQSDADDGLLSGAPLDGGIIPQAANDINEDHSHIGMGSGGGISIPSVSAPHRSLDAIASPAGDTTIEDDSENASVWQSGTGRGIRAHETTTGIYKAFPRSLIGFVFSE